MAKHEMQKLQYIQKLQYLEGEIAKKSERPSKYIPGSFYPTTIKLGG